MSRPSFEELRAEINSSKAVEEFNTIPEEAIHDRDKFQEWFICSEKQWTYYLNARGWGYDEWMDWMADHIITQVEEAEKTQLRDNSVTDV